MKYYRVDVIEGNKIITVCTTRSREEAERQYDIWNETHHANLIENEI